MCPSITGTSLVYSGRAGKSWYNQQGGGSNYQCLPNNPEYGQYDKGVQGHCPIYGTEYQLNSGSPLPGLSERNVPCAVCHVSTRAAVLMIPEWHHCPSQWTLDTAETVPGSHANTNGGLFYHVEANCNGLPCPPYDAQKELTCAVCTK